MADKVGAYNRLGWALNATTATAEFEYLEGTQLGVQEEFLDTNGMRGTRSHIAARVRRVRRSVQGNINFAPTPAELDTLLYLALGTQKSGNTIALAEAVPSHYWIAVRDGTTYNYSGCVVETCRISASEGGPLQLSLSVQGVDEAASGSIGSNTIDDSTGGPYVMSDGAVTVGGTSYEFDSIEIVIQNRLEVKYRNSVTPTQIKAIDRMVTVALPFSQGDASALYGSAVGGVTVVATFTNATCSCAFSFTKVAAPKNPLPFGQRGILGLPWQGVARQATDGTKEIVVTNDSTV